MIACGGEATEETTEETTSEEATTEEVTETIEEEVILGRLDADAFKAKMDEGAGKLVDVRTPDEYSGGTIGEAVNIDFMADNFEEEIQKLDKSTPMLVFCQAGGRSQQAAQKMSELGFTEVYDLLGGYGSWPYKE